MLFSVGDLFISELEVLIRDNKGWRYISGGPYIPKWYTDKFMSNFVSDPGLKKDISWVLM